MIVITKLLEVDTLSMLAGVLEDEGVEGYPGAERALHERNRLRPFHGDVEEPAATRCLFAFATLRSFINPASSLS